MPNWIHNKLSIKGDGNLLCKCLELVYNIDEIDLRKLIPSPKDASIDWFYKHWGTKWNVTKEDTRIIFNSTNTHIVKFTTANAPPKQWLKVLASKFPQLSFCMWYVHPSESYGKIKISGSVIKSQLWDFDEDNNDYKLFIDKHFT